MSNIIPLLEEIKRVYLNTAADLDLLQQQFSKELTTYDERFAPCSYHELTLLFDRMSHDIHNTVRRRRDASHLESKLRKHPSTPKKVVRARPTYLVRVK